MRLSFGRDGHTRPRSAGMDYAAGPADTRGIASARRSAFLLVVGYVVVASLWIGLSDQALSLLGLPLETERAIAAVKGQFFVLATATAAFILLMRHLKRLHVSEERYRRLVEGSPDMVYSICKSRGVLYFSPRAEVLTGYTPGQLRDDPQLWFTLVHPEDRKPLSVALEHGFQGSPVDVEFRFQRADGEWRWLRVRSVSVLQSGGEIIIEGVASDITDRRNAEDELQDHKRHLEDLVEERTAQLQRVNEDLRQTTKAKSRFFAHMSHELRTPLNSIIGFSGVLLMPGDDPLSPERTRQAEVINRSGKLLLHLVNSLLDLSKLEAHANVVTPEEFDAVGVVEECVAGSMHLAAERGLTLRATVPAGPVRMVSDRHMVVQVLLNLLSNALKFTESGTVEVILTQHEGAVDFIVRDTGPGIASEHLEGIFDEFWQVTDYPAVRRQGTGLGLAISRQLAELLGGTLTVESEQGVGSTFTLALPVSICPTTAEVRGA